MAGNQIPFILNQGEKVILDTSSVQYYGVGITNVGFFGGGAFSGLFGGITTSQQTKREKSFWDAQNCHVYLTNLRIVFVKAKLGFANKEAKLENVISVIPLEAIEGIYAGSKLMNPTAELSVKFLSGEINKIAFAFLSVGLSTSFKHKRGSERDEWIKTLEKCRADVTQNVPIDEEPLRILKLRYAKGEVTKDEYEQIKKELSE
jgi:hypothetical protein